MFVVLLFTFACEKSDDAIEESNALVLPPYESMAIDLEIFQDDASTSKVLAQNLKSNEANGNWLFSKIVVGVWNIAVFKTLAVPVTAFRLAFNHTPVSVGDNTWEWNYSVDGFTAEYTARLTGEVTGEEVLWKMYLTKVGIEGFEEFLWFTGSSAMDGNSGSWVLNESPLKPEPIINIDWQRESDEIGKIKYTWVRELNEKEQEDPYKDSTLEYGKQEGEFDAYIDTYVYDTELMGYSDVRIEWNTTSFEGRVMSYNYFEDEMWHCWDSEGADTSCE